MSSLTISNFAYDLLSSNTVYLNTGSDRGVGAPSLSEVQSSYLDGASVTGAGSVNRQITLPIVINLTRAAGADQIAAQLQNAVGQRTWQLTFTPDGGLPIVYDCFRATVTLTSTLLQEKTLSQSLTVTCEALPFGRSPTTQSVMLAGPSVTLIDGLETVPPASATGSATSYTSSRDSTNKTQGSYSSKWAVTLTASGFFHTGWVSTTRTITALNVGGSQSLQVDVAFYGGPSGAGGTLTLSNVTLIGQSGTAYPYASSQQISLTSGASWSTFTLGSSGAPPAELIVGWTLQFNTNLTASPGAATCSVNLDNLRAVVAGQSVSDTQGGIYQIPTVLGTARTPAALALSLAGGGTFGSFLVHRPPQSTPTTLQPSSAQPMIPLNTTGSASYTCPSSVRFEGTYDLWLAVTASSTASRTFTVTVSQGGSSAVFTATVALTSGQSTYVHLPPTARPLTLPIVNYPADSTSATLFSVGSSVSGDTLQDLLLLDTAGQTVIVSGSTPAVNAYIDPPTPATAVGGVWNGSSRASCLSVGAGLIALAGPGPTLFDPGTNTLLLHSPAGVLNGTVTYAPRWQQSAAA